MLTMRARSKVCFVVLCVIYALGVAGILYRMVTGGVGLESVHTWRSEERDIKIDADLAAKIEIKADHTRAYLSYVANDLYVDTARVLAASLKATGTPYDLLLYVTDQVSADNLRKLREIGWKIIFVQIMENPFLKGKELSLVEWATFTKLQLWNSTLLGRDYSKVIFLDADIVVLHNLDSLFECGPLLCGKQGRAYPTLWNINVGVLVYTPDLTTLHDMIDMMFLVGTNSKRSEAGFINKYFLHRCNLNSYLRRSHRAKGVALSRSGYGGDYSPPVFIPGHIYAEDQICQRLGEGYNFWRWADTQHQLLYKVRSIDLYKKHIGVLHYSGPWKPWEAENAPLLSAWFTHWWRFAARVPGLVDEKTRGQNASVQALYRNLAGVLE